MSGHPIRRTPDPCSFALRITEGVGCPSRLEGRGLSDGETERRRDGEKKRACGGAMRRKEVASQNRPPVSPSPCLPVSPSPPQFFFSRAHGFDEAAHEAAALAARRGLDAAAHVHGERLDGTSE